MSDNRLEAIRRTCGELSAYIRITPQHRDLQGDILWLLDAYDALAAELAEAKLIIENLRELNAAGVRGTYACPICGKETPHVHDA